MAGVKLNVFMNAVSGRLGEVVYYNLYNRQFARIHVIPANPCTDKQVEIRRTFGNAVRSWQDLHAEDKNRYNKKARRLSMSGYNLYISEYMKNYIEFNFKRKNHNLFNTADKLSLGESLSSFSVASPYQLVINTYSASKQTFQSTVPG